MKDEKWLDPFANDNTIKKIGFENVITNDLNPDFKCDYNLEANTFLQLFSNDSIDGIVFDPPYSPTQLKRRYNSIGLKTSTELMRMSTWSTWKDNIARVIKPGGHVISFCWNSAGIGKKRGFEIQYIFLLNHGSTHNDTIITIDLKINQKLKNFFD